MWHSMMYESMGTVSSPCMEWVAWLELPIHNMEALWVSLESQKYMTCLTIINEEVNMLHGLRSCSTDCKANYKQKCLHTNLLCSLCEEEDEDQQHLLKCKVLLNKLRTQDVTDGGLEYEDIFSKNVNKQKGITALYMTLFKLRKDLIENQHSQRALSTTNMELRMSSDLHLCIDRLFSGK